MVCPEACNYRYSPVAQAVRIDTTYGFNRINNYSAAVSLNTTFYGTMVRKGTHKIQAIRHKATPSLNYSYLARFHTPRQRVSAGRRRAERLREPVRPRYYQRHGDRARRAQPLRFQQLQQLPLRRARRHRQSQVSFSLQNSVEMKIRDTKDTTGLNPFRKASLIDGLDFNMGYNFARRLAASLSPLSVNFRTQIAQKLNLNSSRQLRALPARQPGPHHQQIPV